MLVSKHLKININKTNLFQDENNSVHSNASNEMCRSFLVSLLDKINLCSVQSAERHIIASQARIVPNICII
jgi:hypothetical protein